VAGGVLVLAVALLDGVDGAIAVMQRRPTRFGAILDATVDRIVDVAFIAGVCLRADRTEATAWWAAAATAGLFLLEYVRALTSSDGAGVQRVTPGERPSRVILMGLAGIGAGTLDRLRPSATHALWLQALGAMAVVTFLSAGLLLRDAGRSAARPQ
jgi:CDP-diacylglycerol--glycerol-3-phosphate 3-phosphatidyltransferase